MKKLLLFLTLISLFITASSTKYYNYESMDIFQYFTTTKKNVEKWSLTIGSLIISNEIYRNVNFNNYINELDEMVKKVKSYVGNSKNPYVRIKAMNKVIFDDYGYKYDHDKTRKEENYFLSTVIDRKSGNCFGLPLLYLCLAERLNYPVYPVYAPWHLFCRYDDGRKTINIEVTSGGHQVSDTEYLDRFLITKKAYRSHVYLYTNIHKRNFIARLSSNISVYYMFKKPNIAHKYLKFALKYNKCNNIDLYIFAGYFYKTLGELESSEKIRKYSFENSKKYYTYAKNLGANYLDPIEYEIAYEKHSKSRPIIRNRDEAMKYYNKLKEKYNDYFN